MVTFSGTWLVTEEADNQRHVGAEAAGRNASGRGVLREVKRVAAMGALECVNA